MIDLINAGGVYSELVLDINKYQSNMKKAQGQMNSFSSTLGGLGSKLDKAGKSLTTKLSLPIAGAGLASLKFGADFEESLNKVSTIADETVKSTDELKEGVISLSDDVGIAATELNESLYQTISATGDTANALDYVEIASKAAIGGFTDTTTSIDGLTTVMNAYGLKGSEAMQRVSDQMLQAQNFGKTTFGEMASSIGNVIPIASSLNISTEELFGSIATLTKNGIQTSQAVTGLKAAYSNILKPTKQASDLAAELGLEFNAAELKSKGWAGFLDEVRAKTGGNSEQLATLFGSVEALNSVTVLATTGSKDFASALDAMNESTGATEKAFSKMDQGVKDSFEDTLNKAKNLGIELSEFLIPAINKIIEKVSGWIDKFRSLDDGTKKNIVTLVGLAAAAGPLLIVGGKVATGVSGLIGLFGKFSAASTTITAATGSVASGLGATGLAAKASALLLNPWVLGLAAVTAGGIALYKHLSKDSIPAVDLFGNSVSESTKKAVSSYMDLDNEASKSLMHLKLTSGTVSSETKDSLTSTFSSMGDQIKTGLDTDFQESYATMESFFMNSAVLTEAEEAAALAKMQETNLNRKAETDSYISSINEILTNASNEKRALTLEEQQEINSIQSKMKETAINALSENELEAKTIMERMKQQADELTAQQAAEVVSNITEQTNKSIEQANLQYDDTIKAIVKQRDEAGTITAEQADNLIEEATRQRDETINKATDMREKVIAQAKEQAGEHVNQVNWETGEIKTKWQVLKTDLESKWESIRKSAEEKWGNVSYSISTSINNAKTKLSEGINKIKEWNSTNVKQKIFSVVERVKKIFSSVNEGASGDQSIGNNAMGTNFWRGGWTWVGEQGRELINLPPATKILSNQKSMDMVNAMSPQQRKIEVTLNIGTLVADDYGLKQLERKLSNIRINENARLGVVT